jgi:hypothetical protein
VRVGEIVECDSAFGAERTIEMSSIIVETKKLNLPEMIANKLKGTKVEILETSEGVLLRSVPSAILSARGILKGKGFSTAEFAAIKEEDKALER